MEVTVNQVDNILKTLPISLYAKRNIDVQLDEKIETSLYNLEDDYIKISYNNVASVIEKLQDEKELETITRGLLYHEVSHGILTPTTIFDRLERIYVDAANIFEDERIETIFKDYYTGVNFKRNILMITNWDRTEPENLMENFFQICRYRFGKPKYVERVSQIIKAYEGITQSQENDYWNRTSISQYKQAIIQFFIDVAQDWLEEHEKEKLLGEEANYDDLSENDKQTVVKRVLQEISDKMLDEMEKDIVITAPAKGKGEGPTPDSTGSKPQMSEAEMQELLEDIERKTNSNVHTTPKSAQKLMDSILNKFIDKNLIDSIEEIFNNFLSRTKNNAGAIQRYSGTLNPRNLVRDDWRIFEYKCQNGPVRGYDKLHLNLFIDTSGSYRSNQDKTNTIIKALDILEDKFDFFEWSLVTCQVGEQIRPKGKRYIEANGGNYLDNKIFGIFKDLQVKNALNYNIMLADGDLWTDCYRDTRENARKNIGAFNTSRCSIISDSDNKAAIEKFAPLAHTTIVEYGHSKSYADMLFDNILNALQRALL